MGMGAHALQQGQQEQQQHATCWAPHPFMSALLLQQCNECPGLRECVPIRSESRQAMDSWEPMSSD